MSSSFTGINIQWPISQLIADGSKIIETRTYPLPAKYLNQDLLLVETPGTLGNFKSRAIGIIRFNSCFKYGSKDDFLRDFPNHLVDQNSPWRWQDGKAKWGWKIEKVTLFKDPQLIPKRLGIKFTRDIQVNC